MEFLWKDIEAIIDTRIKKAMTFHDALHGFCAGRGTGTTITQLKLTQDLESVNHDTLLLMFLDIRKAYYNLEYGLQLKNLEGYWEGPKMRGIMVEFWEQQ